MRIIKAAKKVDEYIINCPYCGSLLGIREVDLQWSAGAWSYCCPVCSFNNHIDMEKSEMFPWKMEGENGRELPSGDTVREYSL